MANHTSGTVTERIRQWLHLCGQTKLCKCPLATSEATEIMELALAEVERLEKIETAAEVVWSGSELDGDISTVDTQELRDLKAALEGGDE